MGITIKEIAEVAGVSKSTVDRALKNGKGIKPETQRKIMAVAQALSYKPNLAGKMLSRNGKSQRIGVIIPMSDVGNELRPGVLDAQAEFAEFGVEFCNRDIEDCSISAILNALTEAQLEKWDAVVVRPYDSALVAQKISELESAGICVITYNTNVENAQNTCFVGQDCFRSGIVAADLMAKLLQRRGKILLVNGWKKWKAEQERTQGFLEKLKQYPDICVTDILQMDALDQGRVFDDLHETVLRKLRENPEIGGVYSAEGTGAALYSICAAIDACGQSGKTQVIGNDSYTTTRQLLEQDKVAFVICQEFYNQGYFAVKMAVYKLLYAMELPAWMQTGIQIVVKENLSDVNRNYKMI